MMASQVPLQDTGKEVKEREEHTRGTCQSPVHRKTAVQETESKASMKESLGKGVSCAGGGWEKGGTG